MVQRKAGGGVYGIAVGGLFAAESMFHTERDASESRCFIWLSACRQRGPIGLLDIQQLTDHTASLGAIEISRDKYLRRLRDAVDSIVEFGELESAK